MKARPWLHSVLSIVLLAGFSAPALAKHAAAPKEENGAVILGEAGESYPIYGAGGIRVTGGHHGFFTSNMKRSEIEIDGSAISAQKLTAINETADFLAAPNCAYFVSQAAVCTLSSAVGAAGEEVIVCNTGNEITITYQTTNGETLFGCEQLGVLFVNKKPGKVDKFISDGKSWYHE
jgi:hypothetical protein